MTQSGGRGARTGAGNAVRRALGSAIVGTLAAAAVVLTFAPPAASVAAAPAVGVAAVAPVAPGPVARATPVTAPPRTTTSAPTSSRARAGESDERPRARSTRASSSTGCGQRAVTAGRFAPSCSEYQGYLDPGTSAGRAPTSGETQTQWGCEQGYIPEDDCG